MVELKSQLGHIREFIGQIREQSELSSSTIVNLIGDFEIAKAITLGSRIEVGARPKMSKHSLEVDKELLSKEEEEDLAMASLEEALSQHPIISNPIVVATLAPPPFNPSKVVPSLILSNLISPNVPIPCRFLQSKKEEKEKDILKPFQRCNLIF
ncbi:hypothetical protein ACFX14_040658 [Malus domestica]